MSRPAPDVANDVELRAAPAGQGRAALWSTCGAHVAQDGLVALQFVLLPLLAQTFGLSYAQVGLLRAISSTALSVLEIPSSLLAERFGERRLLVVGLVGAAIGYIGIAAADSFIVIALCFLIAGAGAAFQHSLSSSILAAQFGDERRRRALGTYNSSGDAGKLTFTAVFSLAVGVGLSWNAVLFALSGLTVLLGLAIWFALRERRGQAGVAGQSGDASANSGWGIRNPARFAVLNAIVLLDSAVQAVFLTFLAFILLAKGASASVAAAGVTIALAGGMAGKLMGGFLAARIGDRMSFNLIQALTLLGLLALTQMPLMVAMVCLPFIGLVVQGSSTVSYGTVPDFLQPNKIARGYGVIYTLSGAASVVGVMIAGLVADYYGLSVVLWLAALAIALTMPLSYVLSGRVS